jgi:predicted TPR repeat methyltransferase
MNYLSCETLVNKHLFSVFLLLAVVTVATYAGSLRNGFVWDDHDVVETYPLNSSLSGLPELFSRTDSISGWPKTPYYRPLARATFVVDRQMFGLRAWCHHAENLLLHLANVLLLFLVARSLFHEALPSLLAAMLFAVHPGISEPVFAVFARNSLLSLLFMLGVMLAFRCGTTDRRWFWTLLASGLFFLGMLSKESTIMVLPLLVLDMRSDQMVPRTALGRLVPFAVALAVYALLRHNALLSEHIPPLTTDGMAERLTSDLYIIPRYLMLVLWPAKLTAWYEIPGNLHPLTPYLVFVWLALAAVIAVVVRFGERAAKYGLLWGICLLVPVLGIWAVPGAPMAERHLYGAFAGFSITAASLGTILLRRHLLVGGACAVMLIVLLSARTIGRSSDWLDDVTLFRAAVEVNPASVNAHYNLGDAFERRHDPEAAMEEWLTVVRLSPEDIDALSKVGTYYFRAGRYEEALPYFAQAAAVHPDIYGLVNNLASTLDMLGRTVEALHRYEQALQIVPSDNKAEAARLQDRIKQLSGNR